jgi:hypothetical protein
LTAANEPEVEKEVGSLALDVKVSSVGSPQGVDVPPLHRLPPLYPVSEPSVDVVSKTNCKIEVPETKSAKYALEVDPLSIDWLVKFANVNVVAVKPVNADTVSDAALIMSVVVSMVIVPVRDAALAVLSNTPFTTEKVVKESARAVVRPTPKTATARPRTKRVKHRKLPFFIYPPSGRVKRSALISENPHTPLHPRVHFRAQIPAKHSFP